MPMSGYLFSPPEPTFILGRYIRQGPTKYRFYLKGQEN
jgi:hypothetical protein